MNTPTPSFSEPLKGPSAGARSWQGLRVALWGCVLSVLVGMLFASVVVAQWSQSQSSARLQTQQTVEVDLWARMLTARIEAHQRQLASLALGLQSAGRTPTEALHALMQQENAMQRWFVHLYMALPQGNVIPYSLVQNSVPELDSTAKDALRRTLLDGKPRIIYMATEQSPDMLQVLLTAPVRHPDGQLPGAVAASVQWPMAALLPQSAQRQVHVQYALLDADGWILLHSVPELRGRPAVEMVVPPRQAQWQALLARMPEHAESQMWHKLLVSRVVLQQPQLQALIVSDLGARWSWGLPASVWVLLLVVAALIALVAVAVMGIWLSPWARSRSTTEVQTQEAAPEQSEFSEEPTSSAAVQARAMALLEATPAALMLEQDGQVCMATPQLTAVLGYTQDEQAQMPLERLFVEVQDLQQVRHDLMALGEFEGLIALRKKDGDPQWLQALVWAPSHLSAATVWQVRLPWRLPQMVPLPGDPQGWQDALTGLPNREAFLWNLQSWISACLADVARHGADHRQSLPTQGCLLFVDLDHLGVINEAASREMGDKVLRHVGRWMALYAQPLGDVARLGGDEFAVLLPGISLVHGQAVAQAICDAVWRWQPHWAGERHWISVSVGLVTVDALRHTPRDALHAADMACYEAKRRGRSQVAVGQLVSSSVLRSRKTDAADTPDA